MNKATEFDAEPTPNMEEVIIKMSGHKFFTKMDLSKGYWQVSLSERSKPLTAFETPSGLFQFKTMPFGLVKFGKAVPSGAGSSKEVYIRRQCGIIQMLNLVCFAQVSCPLVCMSGSSNCYMIYVQWLYWYKIKIIIIISSFVHFC